MGAAVGIDPGKNINGLIPGGASLLPADVTVDVWRNGLEQRSWSCHRPHRFPNGGMCTTGGVAVGTLQKTLDVTQTNTRFLPFPVYSLQGCETSDINSQDYRRMAETALTSGLSSEFAREITTGAFSDNPSFQSVAIPVNTVSDTSIVHAISILIKARTQANVVGASVLHVPIWLLPQLNDHYQLTYDRVSGGTFLGASNIRVSLDYYEVFTPDLDTAGEANGGTAGDATHSYITITGPVEYGLAELTTEEAKGIVQKRINETASLTEQFGIFRFDTCGVYTALVTD